MQWRVSLLILLATALPLWAEDWTTADGKTYKNVIVVSQEDDGLRVTYDGGAGKIVNYQLPIDVQKKYGLDYASLDAKRLAAQKALAEATTDEQRTEAEQKIEVATNGMKLLRQQGYAEGEVPPSNPNPAPPSTAPTSAPVPPSHSPTNAATSEPKPQPVPPAPSPQPSSPEVQNVTPTAPSPGASVMPAPPVPPPEPPLAPATADNPYPGANYHYDSNADVSTLESSVISIWSVSPDVPPPTPTSPSQGTLKMKMTSDTEKPSATDLIEITFHSNTDIKSGPDGRKIRFMVDGAYVHPKEIVVDNGNHPGADTSSRNITFELTPEQAKSIFKDKSVYFTVGATDYMVDEAGVSTFKRYLGVVDFLPISRKDVMSSIHHLISRIPSIITVISTVCTYIVLGGFALVAVLFACAFFVALIRFIKM